MYKTLNGVKSVHTMPVTHKYSLELSIAQCHVKFGQKNIYMYACKSQDLISFGPRLVNIIFSKKLFKKKK